LPPQRVHRPTPAPEGKPGHFYGLRLADLYLMLMFVHL
jgi:hypothetical protein